MHIEPVKNFVGGVIVFWVVVFANLFAYHRDWGVGSLALKATIVTAIVLIVIMLIDSHLKRKNAALAKFEDKVRSSERERVYKEIKKEKRSKKQKTVA